MIGLSEHGAAGGHAYPTPCTWRKRRICPPKKQIINTKYKIQVPVSYPQCSGGLHMVDVSDPVHPRYAGCYSEDGYTHDAQCLFYKGPSKKYFKHEICFAYNENSLTIVDVTNRSAPYMISKRGYTDYAYTHQVSIIRPMFLSYMSLENIQLFL